MSKQEQARTSAALLALPDAAAEALILHHYARHVAIRRRYLGASPLGRVLAVRVYFVHLDVEHSTVNMAALNNLAKFLTPPMPVVSADYDGFEFRYKFFAFRPACKSTRRYPTLRFRFMTCVTCRLQERGVLPGCGAALRYLLLRWKEGEREESTQVVRRAMTLELCYVDTT